MPNENEKNVIETDEKNIGTALGTSSEVKPTSSVMLTKPTSQQKDYNDAPRIIGNQLLVKPQAKNTPEHTDDLFSLEREIAKMHNVDENMESGHASDLASVNASGEKNIDNKMDTTSVIVEKTPVENVKEIRDAPGTVFEVKNDCAMKEAALEHEDLIAVLKGLDDGHNNEGNDAELDLEGVTIEGEGEYQIMEVVDDDYSTPEPDSSTSLQNVKSSGSKQNFGTTLLTTEEERAMALEQIECLKNKNKPRRRKQDIKPIHQADPVMDLVSSLEADWTDNDDDGNKETVGTAASNTPNPNKGDSPVPIQLIESKASAPQITSVVVIPPTPKNGSGFIKSTSTDKHNSTIKEDGNSDENKTSPIDGITITKTDESSTMLSSPTGFRRTRIIKRKIIWDPDAPETTFSYAKLVTSSKHKIKQEPSMPSATITKGSTTIRPIKKEAATISAKKTQQRPLLLKEKKAEVDSNPSAPTKKTLINQKQLQISSNETKMKILKKDESDKLLSDSVSSSSSPIADNTPPNKRRAETPTVNGPGGTKKKKVSELDRLMGDEGAVNMLNSLEKLGETKSARPRPMMRSRAATICEKLPRKESTSPTKISPPATTTPKSGKRTPKPRASSGWDYVYQQKQNLDDSMIIRRRSNSSYSSTASLNRLSLDGQTTPNGPNSSSKITTSANVTPEGVTQKSSTSRTSEDTLASHVHGNSAGAGTKISPKSFEFAKPENKKVQRRTKSPAAIGTLANDLKKPAPVANKRNVRSPIMADDKSDVGGITLKTTPPTTTSTGKEKVHTSDVIVKKSAKIAQIIFSTNKAKMNYTFTTQMLNKLSDILDKLAADPDTHVTVILTNDTNFCQGVDLTEIAVGSMEKRKNSVKHLSSAVRHYLKTLASFPKPLVAGVNGHVMNLGVMQLAFFDIVVAGDKCTYESQYARMGQVPEGYSVWNNLNKIRGSFKTKLFWLNEKIQSTEAALAGLVNKLTTGNKVNEEALSIARKIASLSPVSYRAMKKPLSRRYINDIDDSFDEEFTSIAEQWTSSEFLDNIRKYVEQGHF
ncbi:HP1 and insulator partner protein 1 [Haematobia irritans]|uniref:HP1 and insulator partner protein 1 n=1 Tax=Haematobia irritans TaxID=7368 RepID=UPI003F500145